MPSNGLIKKPTTGQLKKSFLKAYQRIGRVDLAAKEIGISRALVYDWKSRDDKFSEKFSKSKDYIAGMLEDEAYRRACEGTAKPVYQQGEKVGEIQEYSDTLCIFLLKALKPEKYRERYDVRQDATIRQSGQVTIYIPDNGRDKKDGV